jgi:hypothetical protein
MDVEHDGELRSAFRNALALERQPSATLHSYQTDRPLTGAASGRVTGVFAVAASAEQAALRRALQECARLDAEIARLRATAGSRWRCGGLEPGTQACGGGSGCRSRDL